MSACGEAQEEFSLCPGRSSPELASALFHLEAFCMSSPALHVGYMDEEPVPFVPKPGLLSATEFPELLPYRSLDADRLRLIGEGLWNMEAFLDGPLWLPFQEPAFLRHGLPISHEDLPNFSAESPTECLKLAKIWDRRGLLTLFAEPAVPGMSCRTFNAYKDHDRDRQIGDRRLPNLMEYHIDGPSKRLPQGSQLTCLRVPRFTHILRGSITDRRDFYHQAKVTLERAQSNMMPFSYPAHVFDETRAMQDFVMRARCPETNRRQVVGDKLGQQGVLRKKKSGLLIPEKLYPCFSSLFQGDHLGVEFALRSHSLLLENHGLLLPQHRLLGNSPVPAGPCWDALVIDDYFAIGSQRLGSDPKHGFAHVALDVARKVYHDERLLGSDEKDIVASFEFKAAGAEVRSCPMNARRGIVPVGAPLAKRVALSVVSLRAACLPGITSRLASRLAGNWVSVLQYRKCLSSLIDGFFKLSNSCLAESRPQVHKLPRSIACELVSLSAIAPLMFSNVAVDFLDEAFATDASNQKGAIVSTCLDEHVHESVWLGADKKGSYTHLDNDFRAILRQVGEADDDYEAACPGFVQEPIRKQ